MRLGSGPRVGRKEEGCKSMVRARRKTNSQAGNVLTCPEKVGGMHALVSRKMFEKDRGEAMTTSGQAGQDIWQAGRGSWPHLPLGAPHTGTLCEKTGEPTE